MNHEISYARVKSQPVEAQAYHQRNQRRHRHEMLMIEQAMNMTEGVRTVLDAPCGVGRASIWLAGKGYEVTGIDLGEAALALASQLAVDAGVQVQFATQDLFAMPYRDRAFDATLCFRFLHHFESPELRSRLIAEICRVSKRHVLISRMTPVSVTSMRRRIRYFLTGKPVKQYPMNARELDREMRRCGFEAVGHSGRLPLLSSLQLQVYRRKEGGMPL